MTKMPKQQPQRFGAIDPESEIILAMNVTEEHAIKTAMKHAKQEKTPVYVFRIIGMVELFSDVKYSEVCDLMFIMNDKNTQSIGGSHSD